MSEPRPELPAAETINTDSVYLWDSRAEPLPPGTRARPRPPGRPKPTGGPTEFLVECIDFDYTPPPPGAVASRRPVGRERWRLLPAETGASLFVGDLVALRSGGPPMTVLGFSASMQDAEPGEAPAAYVWCAWFTNGDCRRAVLPRAALVPVTNP